MASEASELNTGGTFYGLKRKKTKKIKLKDVLILGFFLILLGVVATLMYFNIQKNKKNKDKDKDKDEDED